ncbi:MAG: hypothetical protein JNK05_01605 [Myxococcales bacterium]|nr:hypothetical protein [Myxococcales bacterium]
MQQSERLLFGHPAEFVQRSLQPDFVAELAKERGVRAGRRASQEHGDLAELVAALCRRRALRVAPELEDMRLDLRGKRGSDGVFTLGTEDRSLSLRTTNNTTRRKE